MRCEPFTGTQTHRLCWQPPRLAFARQGPIDVANNNMTAAALQSQQVGWTLAMCLGWWR
jgi:hypothetical protein